MEWRELKQEEKDVVIPYYKKYYCDSSNLLPCVLLIGAAMLIYTIGKAVYEVQKGAQLVDIRGEIISNVVLMAVVCVVIPLFSKLLSSGKEIKAIQNSTARICETNVVSKRIGTYGWSEEQGYGGPDTPIAHYIKVAWPDGEAREVEVMSQVYNGAGEGDVIYLFDPCVRPGEAKDYKLFLKNHAERDN